MTKWLKLACAAGVLFLTGCTATSSTQWAFPPMAVPRQPTLQQEIQLARLDNLLQRNDLNDASRAQVHYERGLLHDSLGMRDLARLDFNQSLSLKPDQPDVFNILGVYFTQSGHYDAAYEAFDSTLELDSKHVFAERNRGIALYYGGRFSLAHEDLIAHYYDDVNDAYRSIWLYLVELDLFGRQEADKLLSARLSFSDQSDWGWQIARLLLDDVSEGEFFRELTLTSEDNQQLAQRLCEGYFYLAKKYQFAGNLDNAVALYKLSMSGNIYEYVEHRYALLELSRIAYEQG